MYSQGPLIADGVLVTDENGFIVATCRQSKPLNTMQALDNAVLFAASIES